MFKHMRNYLSLTINDFIFMRNKVYPTENSTNGWRSRDYFCQAASFQQRCISLCTNASIGKADFSRMRTAQLCLSPSALLAALSTRASHRHIPHARLDLRLWASLHLPKVFSLANPSSTLNHFRLQERRGVVSCRGGLLSSWSTPFT